MTQLPTEAKAGLTRAWLAILAERHPGTSWVVVTDHKAQHSAEDAVELEERALAA